MKDLISIIIPNRKGEKNDSLESIKNQSYKNLQIINIIDKNSKGASWARNQGLKKAKGKYIFFCDNDVRLEPDCLENLYNTLQKNKDADWAFGRFKIDGEEYNMNRKPNDYNIHSKDFIYYFFGISTMSLIRAKAKPKFDEKFKRFNDWDLWVRLTRAGHKPVFCDHCLFETEYSKERISSGDSTKDKEKIYDKHLKKIADIVIPHHSQHDMLAEVLKRIDNKIFNIIIVSGGTFGQNCNKGAKLAETNNIIFLNDDTEPTNEILIKMVDEKHSITGVGQYIPAIRKKKFGIRIDRYKFQRFLSNSIEENFMPSGFCFKIKKKTWERLGGFDNIYKNGAEDIDLFLRARSRRIKFGYLEDCITHFLSKSENRFDHAGENDIILERKWKKKIMLKGKKPKEVVREIAKKGDEMVLAINSFHYKGRDILKGNWFHLSVGSDIDLLREKQLIN